MYNKLWENFKSRDVINILDGDTSIGRLKINNQFFDVTLPYLKGTEICDLSNSFNEKVFYANYSSTREPKSRWQYLRSVINIAIRENKMSILLDKIFDRHSIGKMLNEVTQQYVDYKTTVPVIEKLAIQAINNVMYLSGYCLEHLDKNWRLVPITSSKNLNTKSQTKLRHVKTIASGFYILPFQKETEGIMHAIQNQLKNENVDFKLEKCLDIFDPKIGDDILTNIREGIKNAPILVADISNKNPNVFYELGLAHAYEKPVILICNQDSYNKDYKNDYPFDIHSKYVFSYTNNDYDSIHELAKNVVDRIRIILDSNVNVE